MTRHRRRTAITTATAAGIALTALGSAAVATTAPEPAGDSLLVYDESAKCGTDEYGGNIAKLEAVDELTFKLTLCNPDVAIPSKVAFSSFGIVPSESLGNADQLVNSPIGTGPYTFGAWERGSQIVLNANADYWGEPALSSTAVFQWNMEANQRLVALQSGSVDGIDNVGTTDWDSVAADESLQLIPREPLNIFYLGFNVDQEPFNDPNVRRAIALTLDRERIVANFYPEGSTATTQFLPSAIPGYEEGFVDFERNTEEAQALLAESGYEDGLTIPLSYRVVDRGYLPDPAGVAVDIQAQLAEIGITVELDEQESTTFIDNSNAGELGMYMLGWGADYPDPSNFFDYHFGPNASPQFGAGFPDVHAAITAAGQTTDPAERATLYAEVNALLAEHIPMIPVANGGSGTAYKADVTGAHSSPLTNENLSVMGIEGQDQFVFMQSGEPGGLWCADESDGESLRVCEQVVEALLAYEVGGTEVVPALATGYESNEELTEWTFTLREGVTFHDGSAFDATDVVENYRTLWDAADPRHVGRTGEFYYFSALFGGFLNPPPPAEEEAAPATTAAAEGSMAPGTTGAEGTMAPGTTAVVETTTA